MKKLLKLMPHAQATVETFTAPGHSSENYKTVLTSYETKAAEIDENGIFKVLCWCSPTTRRHVTAFYDEYVLNVQNKRDQANTGGYQTCKALFEGHMGLNIVTGEVCDLDGAEK